MSRTRRLSLRARMLVMLVGVTTVLLLIMGTVSTYLLAQRVNAQAAAVDKRLSVVASLLARNPQEAQAANLTHYSVVEIPVRPQLTVVPLTQGSLTNQLVSNVQRQLRGSGFGQVQALVQAGQETEARVLLVARGCDQFPYLGCKPVVLQKILLTSRWVPAVVNGKPVPGGRAVLFVGQQQPAFAFGPATSAAAGQRRPRQGARLHHRGADHRYRADSPAGAGRRVADRPRPGAAGRDDQDG